MKKRWKDCEKAKVEIGTWSMDDMLTFAWAWPQNPEREMVYYTVMWTR